MDPVSRIIKIEKPKEKVGCIAVCTAGTADIPVAEEAAQTAEYFGSYVERIYDVGVAGIHRLLAKVDEIQSANCIVAVAGMEGALASVIGGLVDKPGDRCAYIRGLWRQYAWPFRAFDYDQFLLQRHCRGQH